MTSFPVGALQARRVLMLLTFTRWFPVGLTIGVTTLLVLERGMSLAQLGVIFAMQGFVVLGLELPTGGFADALGRRPVLVASAVVALVSGVVFITAHSFTAFVVALLLQGVFRALDSGPLEAWYVDTAHAEDPSIKVEDGLSRAGTTLGLAIASGALISGGLIAWHPVRAMTALEFPYWCALGFYAAHLVAVALLVRDYSRHLGEQFERWLDVEAAWPVEWRDAAGMSDSFIVATASQVEELKAEMDDLLARYRRVGQGNPNARRLAVYTIVYPLDLDRTPRSKEQS